jgi:hypothetical protein
MAWPIASPRWAGGRVCETSSSHRSASPPGERSPGAARGSRAPGAAGADASPTSLTAASRPGHGGGRPDESSFAPPWWSSRPTLLMRPHGRRAQGRRYRGRPAGSRARGRELLVVHLERRPGQLPGPARVVGGGGDRVPKRSSIRRRAASIVWSPSFDAALPRRYRGRRARRTRRAAGTRTARSRNVDCPNSATKHSRHMLRCPVRSTTMLRTIVPIRNASAPNRSRGRRPSSCTDAPGRCLPLMGETMLTRRRART